MPPRKRKQDDFGAEGLRRSLLMSIGLISLMLSTICAPEPAKTSTIAPCAQQIVEQPAVTPAQPDVFALADSGVAPFAGSPLKTPPPAPNQKQPPCYGEGRSKRVESIGGYCWIRVGTPDDCPAPGVVIGDNCYHAQPIMLRNPPVSGGGE